jgi:hypothetical protein
LGIRGKKGFTRDKAPVEGHDREAELVGGLRITVRRQLKINIIAIAPDDRLGAPGGLY